MSFETAKFSDDTGLNTGLKTTAPVLGSLLRAYIKALAAMSRGCAAVFGPARASAAEMDLLMFPDALWQDCGAPRNGLERWAGPSRSDRARRR